MARAALTCLEAVKALRGATERLELNLVVQESK